MYVWKSRHFWCSKEKYIENVKILLDCIFSGFFQNKIKQVFQGRFYQHNCNIKTYCSFTTFRSFSKLIFLDKWTIFFVKFVLFKAECTKYRNSNYCFFVYISKNVLKCTFSTMLLVRKVNKTRLLIMWKYTIAQRK
jgi:hypothetical protein